MIGTAPPDGLRAPTEIRNASGGDRNGMTITRQGLTRFVWRWIAGVVALVSTAQARQLPPPGTSPAEEARYWLARTSLPQAATNHTVPTPKGEILSRGTNPLGMHIQISGEAPVPKYSFDVTDKAQVLRHHQTYTAALFPLSYDLGGVPVTDTNGIILAPRSPTQVADQASQLAFSSLRYLAGFKDTHFTPECTVLATHGSAFVASRAFAFNFARIHNAANDPQLLNFGPFRSPEALAAVARGNISWGASVSRRYFGDVAHLQHVYSLRRTFGLASSHGAYDANCLYMGPDRPEPDKLTDNITLSMRGYVQLGSTPLGQVFGYFEDLPIYPQMLGATSYDFFNIFMDAASNLAGAVNGRRERRVVYSFLPNGGFYFATPVGFATQVFEDSNKNRVNLRFEYRKSINDPWKTYNTFIEIFDAQTPTEKLPEAAIAGVSLSEEEQLTIDVVAPPGKGSRVLLKAKSELNTPWYKVLEFQPNLVVSRLQVPLSVLQPGTAFFDAEITQYRATEAEVARAAGIPPERIAKP
jgi:hypothetical protein